MCGIVGYWSKEKFNDNIIIEMGNKIRHRGPDATGYWKDQQTGINFCHLRLSILDLSSAGSQPMISNSGRFVVIYNGEIYNYLAIKKEICDISNEYKWRGHSDTEVFLAGFEAWGIETTVKKLIGMFAMAIWDRKEQELYLVRDRIGEKPLYYGWQGNAFLFGSELKPFKAHPSFKNEIDQEAVASFFKYNYIPAPLSIYKGIKKLEPGTYCRISLNNNEVQQYCYWSLENVIRSKEEKRRETIKDNSKYVDELDFLLKDAIKNQMLSDVPLGAFLSGGVDSSTIVALMQEQSMSAIKTYTIGFEEDKFNEAIFAKKVAEYLHTDHTELYVSSQDALNVIPLLPNIYDEPFSGSSQIPTFLVSNLARKSVTVSLSGDAGDELFSGYNRYILAQNAWKKFGLLPLQMRKKVGHYIKSRKPETLNGFYNFLDPLLPTKYKFQNFADKMHKASALLEKSTSFDLYDTLITHWQPNEILAENAYPKIYGFSNIESLSFIEKMMNLDTLTYLPDDILVKVDRAAMANSLETRVPFLDHRVIEFAWGLPLSLKLNDGKGKWILREVLYKYVPKKLIERPKMGFGVPLDSWIRGPLKEWGQDLISKRALDKHGLLNQCGIEKKWNEHQTGEKNWQYLLWDVLMFQAWYDHNLSQ